MRWLDCGRRQADRLGNAQARGVADGQDDAMLQQLDGIEKAYDLIAAQYDGQPLRLAAGRNDIVDAPLPLERDLVEEADRGDGHQHRACRELPVLAQMNLVGSDVVGSEQLGRLAGRTGRFAADTSVGCAARDCGPAYPLSCAGEAGSWTAPMRDEARGSARSMISQAEPSELLEVCHDDCGIYFSNQADNA